MEFEESLANIEILEWLMKAPFHVNGINYFGCAITPKAKRDDQVVEGFHSVFKGRLGSAGFHKIRHRIASKQVDDSQDPIFFRPVSGT